MHCATRRSVAPHRPLSSVSVAPRGARHGRPHSHPAPLAEVVRIACRHCETAAFAHEQVSLHHAKTAFAPHDSHVCATRKAHPAAFGNHAAGAGADTLQLQMTAGAETLTITNDSYSHAENAPVTLSHAGSRSPLRADPLRRAERRRAGMKRGGETSHRLPPPLKLSAEGEGFKPPIPVMGIPDFESSAFGHSANLPFFTMGAADKEAATWLLTGAKVIQLFHMAKKNVTQMKDFQAWPVAFRLQSALCRALSRKFRHTLAI